LRILAPEQYEFQKNISTKYAILDIIMIFYDNISQEEYSGLISLDLKMRLTPSHKILLKNLDHYGVFGSMLTFIKSYLNRQQFVS